MQTADVDSVARDAVVRLQGDMEMFGVFGVISLAVVGIVQG